MVRRLSMLGRLVAVLAILAGVWGYALWQMESFTRDTEAARTRDRVAFARGFADAVKPQLDALEVDAAKVAASGPVGVPREAFVLDARMRVAQSSRVLAPFVGQRVPPCIRAGVADTALDDLVAAAARAAASRVLDAPVTCVPSVAFAVRGRLGTGVVLADPSELTARLVAASLLPESRAWLVSPGGTALTASGTEQPPERVASLARDRRERAVTYSLGDEGPRALAAVAPLAAHAGWGVVIEQDASSVEIPAASRPAAEVAVVLTLVFAVVFGLLVLFDVRRRRAHGLAEADKSDFLSIAGHELRTPLTALAGFGETLTSRWDDLDDDKRRMLVDRLVPQIRRLTRTIERTLTAANLRAGTHARPVPRPVAVAERLEQAAARFASGAPLHTFSVDCAGDVPEALADPAALDSVLDQLLENAVKYSPTGGAVELSARRTRRGVEIAVADEGIGLPTDARRIFEPLVQGEAVDRRVHAEGGVGVGLYVARSLVEGMGGRIRAERHDPKGARFVVLLRAERTGSRAGAAN